MDARSELEKALKANINWISVNIAKSEDEVFYAQKRLDNDKAILVDAQKELANFYLMNQDKAA